MAKKQLLNIHPGKGSKRRPEDPEKYDNAHRKIFGQYFCTECGAELLHNQRKLGLCNYTSCLEGRKKC